MNTQKSSELFAEAQLHMPGGVNSPVRAFKSVGRDPLYIERAKGFESIGGVHLVTAPVAELRRRFRGFAKGSVKG